MKYNLFYKREKDLTTSRKNKKTNIKKVYMHNINLCFYLTNLRYNLIKYFLKNQDIYINYYVLYNLINEEKGFLCSFGY